MTLVADSSTGEGRHRSGLRLRGENGLLDGHHVPLHQQGQHRGGGSTFRHHIR